ncbi:MAG: YgjV family protein [Eubacteriales bacterium]|nr:YgjV family protein [Eubacteriales bacterium]
MLKTIISNEVIYNVFVQGLGVLGILASVLSFQCKKHSHLMLLRTSNELLFGIQYIFFGAYTGTAMNFIGCVRNQTFSALVKRRKSTLIVRIVFCILFTVFGLLTWAGIKSIIICLAKIISTIAYGDKNVFKVRLMILTSSSAWLIYNILVGAYAGAINEILTLSSIIIALIRIDIPELKQCRKSKTAIEARPVISDNITDFSSNSVLSKSSISSNDINKSTR